MCLGGRGRTGLEGSAARGGEQTVDERRPRDAERCRIGDEPGQAERLALVERHRCFRLPVLVPDAEADVPLLGGRPEVARDTERPARVGLHERVRPEELDEFAAERRRAPGAEAERLLERTSTLPTRCYRHSPSFDRSLAMTRHVDYNSTPAGER